MNPAGKKILAPAVALALAALLLAGSVALVAYWFSTGFVSIGSPSNRDLIETPIARDKSAANDKPVANAKPPAFRVALATVPGAPRPIDPSIVASTGQGSRSAAAAVLPQPVAFSAPAPLDMPQAVDMPSAVHSELDIALHPSLKYNRNWAPVAPKRAAAAAAAYEVPIIPIGKKAKQLAQSLPSAPKPILDDPSAQTQRLIDQNLEMEEDRRFVMSMCQDQQGCLWVGTEGNGVQRFDPSAPELHQWKEFTTKDGLGDDYGYALACDHLGRIWVGHLHSGLSVYNGQKWQNYEVVGGLSKPDSLSGPLGERIFHITVCPELKSEAVFTDSLTGKQSAMSGGVWMCTSAGLSIYFPSTDSWSYLTRAEGLPSDQANSLAFGSDGTAYLGTQCDGMGVANSTDGYKAWRTVTGPDEEPATPSGDGLPTNLINDVLVATDGTVYAATDAGLAWSEDRGLNWRYVRGRDWVDKAGEMDKGGRRSDLNPPLGIALSEDYCTCLSEDAQNNLWIGHRRQASECLQQNSVQLQFGRAPDYTQALTDYCGVTAATYGRGLQHLGVAAAPGIYPTKTARAELPRGAQLLTLLDLHKFIAAAGTESPSSDLDVNYTEEDWRTQGSWMRRYGNQMAANAAMGAPFDYVDGDLSPFFVYSVQIGPVHRLGDSTRYWIGAAKTADVRALQCRTFEGRRYSSWDDHGEAYGLNSNHPGIYVSVTLPPGAWRMSLYFVNFDGHNGENVCRDYAVSVLNGNGNNASPDSGEVLARCRVSNFFGGVWKTFLLPGARKYTIRVEKKYSLNAICSGLYFDALDPHTLPTNYRAYVANIRRQRRNLNQPIDENPAIGASAMLDELSVLRTSHPNLPTPRLIRLYSALSSHLSRVSIPGSTSVNQIQERINLAEHLATCYDAMHLFDERDASLAQLKDLFQAISLAALKPSDQLGAYK
jgi:outer membrane protein assembly factor BamB